MKSANIACVKKEDENMKRNLFLLLILVLCMALVFTACGNDEQAPPVDNNGEEGGEEEVVPTAWYDMVKVDWEEKTVDLDTGITMAYMVCGPEDGTPIVLIHGATDSRISWAQVAPILAEKYRVYVPELRGHGNTDKPDPAEGAYTVDQHTQDIVAFMKAVGLEKANIAGHSLGSFIAQQLAVQAPDMVSTITLIASGAVTTGNETLDWVYNGDGTDYLGVHGYDAEQAMPEGFLRDWTACTNEDADFCEAIYQHAAALPYADWAYIFGGILEYDSSAQLAEITCPVQIFWGTEDVIFSAEDEQALQDGLTSAETVKFEQIEGASHNTHWDSKAIASQVAGLIGDFAK